MRFEPKWSQLIAVAALVVLLVGAAGCAASPDEHVSEPAEAPDVDRAEPEPGEVREDAELASDEKLASAAASQKIIRNAQISLQVDSPEDASLALEEIAGEMDGYVSEISQRQVGDRRVSISMTVRIPAEDFSAYRSEVTALGTVTDSRIWTTDVTEEYTDVQARLQNMKSEEEALLRLLDEAETVEEVLGVRERLADVRGRIDSLQGRLRYMTDRIDYSTFRIQLQPETLAGKAVTATGFYNFWPRLAQALIRGTNWMLNAISAAVMTLAMALPSLILLGAVGWGVFRLYRRLRHGR